MKLRLSLTEGGGKQMKKRVPCQVRNWRVHPSLPLVLGGIHPDSQNGGHPAVSLPLLSPPPPPEQTHSNRAALVREWVGASG